MLIVGAAALVVAAVVLQTQGRRQASDVSAAQSSSSCSPAPCADAGGYRMRVDSVTTAGQLVRVSVSFAVHGRDRMHAVPEDFSVREASGRRDRPVFQPSAGCSRWERTDIADGGTLGPEMLCFRTSGSHGPLTLNWDPDVGISEYFSPGYDVRI